MKHTLLSRIPENIPKPLAPYLNDAPIYDSSSSPEARVYFIDKLGGLYLKRGAPRSLYSEAVMDNFFHEKGLGAEVVDYLTDEYDWLLTTKVVGEDATSSKYLENPKRLCDTIGARLRELHELDCSAAPIKDRTENYLAKAHEGHSLGKFDTSYAGGKVPFKTAEEAYKILSERERLLKSEVLIHGDYCLPNIILYDWKLSGFIDLGGGGIGDRHVDIFWGAWTLVFNLKTDRYTDRFFDAYGKDKINPDALLAIAAAETFA